MYIIAENLIENLYSWVRVRKLW